MGGQRVSCNPIIGFILFMRMHSIHRRTRYPVLVYAEAWGRDIDRSMF